MVFTSSGDQSSLVRQFVFNRVDGGNQACELGL